MARMHPAEYPEETPIGETIVFESLKDQLGDEYDVFFSVKYSLFPKGSNVVPGESDFVICHKKYGILILEVKGGQVHVEGDTWTCVDGSGSYNATSPIHQANKIQKCLQDLFMANPKWGLSHVRIDWLVMLPNMKLDRAPIGTLPPEKLLDGNDLGKLGERIAIAMESRNPLTAPISNEAMGHLHQVLRPNRIIGTVSLACLLSEADRVIERLTLEQREKLEFIADKQRAIIEGVAGSGKTLLACIKARQFAQEGKRVLLTCFNRPLAHFLKSQMRNTPEVHVFTFHHYCKMMADRAGIALPEPPDETGHDQYYNRDHPEALLDALALLPAERFDAVVVDEGQDFMIEWLDLLSESLINPKTDPIYVFLDDVQSLYSNESAQIEMLGMTKGGTLTRNRRNTDQIHRVAETIMPRGTKPSEVNGPDVRWIEADDPAAELKAVKKLIAELIQEHGLTLNDIAVLTLTGRGNRKITTTETHKGATISKIGNYLAQDATSDDPNKIIVESIHRFKGLDAKAVILVELDGCVDRFEKVRQTLYVGITRARGFLAVVGREPVLARLKGAG